MKNIIERIAGGAKIARYLPKAVSTRLAVAALAALAAGGAWASIEMTNPVTGQKESYVNTFTGGTDGTATEWNDTANWDPAVKPFISGGNYNASLVNGKTASTETSIDGWALQVGAYNDAHVTWKSLGKIQTNSGTMWMTVDGTSSITINGWGGGNLGQNGFAFNYYVAANNGVTWSVDLASGTDQGLTMNYYLAKNGSVSYKALGKATHVIKQADVTLSGTSQVSSKTLVSFTSSSITFTADAAIKVYGTDGTTLVETVNLAEVKTAPTLTAAAPVGSCEIVQTTTGIVLYYVDGDPSAVVAKTYKPSININFTHSGGNLTTSADVGLAPYAVPGTVWNNYAVPSDGATSTQTSVYSIDATGAKSPVSGATVSISGTRGSYTCNTLTPASDLRHGYIDETATAGQNTPTVVVSDIPFDHYTVVVYTAADTENATFNYITVNGTDYTYVNEKLATGTSAWGNAGAANSANALAEGVNVLVSPVTSGSTATIVGHRASNTCRGNIAAVQIVGIGENDLVIELDGDKTHTFEEAKTYDTVYVTGSGTLTFAGTASTATTLDISGSAAVNMNGSSLTPTAVTGTGTAIYTGVLPAEGLGWTASAWYGTVWIKNYTTKVASFQSNKYGNAASTLRLTGMNGYFDYKWTGDNATAKYSQNVAIELVDDGDTPAFTYNDGWEKTVIYFAKLKGAGTLRTAGSGNKQTLYFANADEFTGTFDLAAQKIQIGGDEQANKDTTAGNGKLIVAGTSAMTANVKTANGGIYITGTLNGSIATTNTVTISGTMNIAGAVTTEAIISVENGGALNIANGGTLKLTRNTDDDGINPYAGVTIKSGATCTIASGGTITTDNSVTSTYYQFVVNGSMTVAGAFTTVADVAVNAGGSLTITGTLKAYWGIANSGTITLNGIDNVPAYASGYPTTITNSDTGVVKLTSTGSVDDSAKDYSTIKGTGIIEYCGSSWRSLPQTMFATTLSVVANQADGVVAKHNNTVIGSLSGTKNLRSDLGDSGKTLTIKQAKDGVWSGIFKGGGDRLATIVVAPGDSTTGTLTLAGTQDQANWTDALTVSGFVNLTGTWQGDTTVSGTFGGTGTLTGNLTFNAGSTFKAFASDTDGLAVSGTVTCPVEGTVTVDVSALEQTGTKVLMTASGLDVSKFALASGQRGKLSVADGALKVSFVTYAASYGGTDYETIQEAIDAAVADGHTYAAVTILDATAECPAGYYVDTENSNALTKYQAAYVLTDSTVAYYKTAQLAVEGLEALVPGTSINFDHFEVYDGSNVAMSMNPAKIVWATLQKPFKVKCLNGATVAVTINSVEFDLSAGDPDENGIVTYTKTNKATTYVWVATSVQAYARPSYWKVGSAEGATATRTPDATDTVVIGDGASLSGLSSSWNVAALQVSGTVTFIGDGGGSLTSASAITLGANDSIVITGTLSPVPTTSVADSYVKATTSGSTTTYTVATQPTVSDVAFEYGADYATATVTATVAGDATAYKLTVGQNSYDGVVSGSTVTFSNVATGHASAYDSVSYTITAKDGETAVPVTSGGAGTAIVADVTAAGWINENATTTGTRAGGSWTNAVTYTNGKAEISDNMFEASTASTASQVVLEFNVCFSAVSDADVEGNPQAAVKLGEVDSATTFMVLTNGNNWAAVSNAGLTPDASATYKVVLTIDYGTGSYGVTVGDNALTNATGSASFPLAASKTSVQNIAFAGSGVLTSMRGDQREGYMVVDKNGRRYPTIDAAIDAYNADSTIGPLTLLHAGTEPSGWKIEDNTLIKLPQGFYFIAY